MQNWPARAQIIILALAVSACSRGGGEFEALIRKSRGTEVDQVNAPSAGLPFYTAKTLNPIWQTDEDPIVHIPKLSLIDQSGTTRDEKLFQGKTTFVSFFFATCHGICPVVMRAMKKIDARLKKKEGVQFVALSVDATHDTPAILKDYARKNNLGASWTLLTGDEKRIHELARETFVNQAFKRPSPEGTRNFVHSEYIYVLDPEGRLRAVLNGTRVDLEATAESVSQQIRL